MALRWKKIRNDPWGLIDLAHQSAKSGQAAWPRIDPYLLWAELTEFQSFGNFERVEESPVRAPQHIFLMIEVPVGRTVQDLFYLLKKLRLDGVLKISSLSRPHYSVPGSRFCTAITPGSGVLFDRIRESRQLRLAIARFQLGLPIVDSMDGQIPSQLFGAIEVKSYTAVIDESIAFAHGRFNRLDGAAPRGEITRVEWFWDQDGPHNPGTVDYGVEETQLQIEKYCNRCTQQGVVDEDDVYLTSKHLSFTGNANEHKGLGRRVSHGTHVMDVACGSPSLMAAPQDQPIIAVQLPGRTVRDTSGASLGPHVLDALHYILLRATDLNSSLAPAPIVVNLSYATIAGPHDGSGMLEAAIDQLIDLTTARPLNVVLPAGNDNLSRCHAQALLDPGQVCTFDWRIQPDGTTPSFLEIWLSPGPDSVGDVVAGPEVSVTLQDPGGITSSAVTEGQVEGLYDGSSLVAGIVYLGPVANGDGRMILLVVLPTAPFEGAEIVAPAGRWVISVQNIANSGSTRIDAWIQRNDTPLGYPIRGRQSYFDDPAYERFDEQGRWIVEDPVPPTPGGYVFRGKSVNPIATGEKTVVIGGYRRSDRSLARYSAAGPVRADPLTGAIKRSLKEPDAVAVSDDCPGLQGVLAAGTRTGASLPSLSGTSVAAPLATRWIAGNLPAGAIGARPLIESRAAHDEALPIPGSPLSIDRGGKGRLIIDPTPPRTFPRIDP
jgi:hypothetical protein